MLVHMSFTWPIWKIPVSGHRGNLVFGYLRGKYVVFMQGRIHPFECGMNLGLVC